MTPEEYELLSKLTIVIPTYNRPLELERSIEYWRDTPVTVHILDGSTKPCFPEGELSGAPNIKYHYFDPNNGETLYSGYRNRLYFATQLPKTQFSALIGDEDFFTISGLCASLKILFENREICSVTGFTVGFESVEGLTKWGMREFQEFSLKNFASPRVRARLKPTQSGELPILYYGIFQTDIWRKTLSLTFRQEFPVKLIGGEHLFHTVALALGPMLQIRHVLWLRKFWAEKVDFEKTSYRRGDRDRYLLNKSNKTEARDYYAILAAAIHNDGSGLGGHRALRLSRKVLKPNFKSAQSGFKYRLRKKLARTLVRSGSVVPPSLRLALNRLMGNTFTKSLGFVEVRENLRPAHGRLDINIFLNELSKTEVDFEESEFRDIEKLLLKPREELRLRANI